MMSKSTPEIAHPGGLLSEIADKEDMLLDVERIEGVVVRLERPTVGLDAVA
jgi:hypothetical protein